MQRKRYAASYVACVLSALEVKVERALFPHSSPVSSNNSERNDRNSPGGCVVGDAGNARSRCSMIGVLSCIPDPSGMRTAGTRGSLATLANSSWLCVWERERERERECVNVAQVTASLRGRSSLLGSYACITSCLMHSLRTLTHCARPMHVGSPCSGSTTGP